MKPKDLFLVAIISAVAVIAYIAATVAIGYYFVGICILHASDEVCIECGTYTFMGITMLIGILIKIAKRAERRK